MAYTSIYDGSQVDEGVGASYIPLLQSAPTSSTLTYTRSDLPSGHQTVDFVLGQMCRVLNNNADLGYDYYQLRHLQIVIDGQGQTKVAYWYKIATASKMTDVSVITVTPISLNTSSECTITGSSNSGKAETIIYTNSGNADLTVTVPTTYSTPDGQAIELTCPAGGYCEVSYLNIGGTIYARGL